MTPDGPLRALDEDAAARARRRASRAAAPEAVAVVLLHSYRHPEHERALGDALAERAARRRTSRSRTRSSGRSASTSAPRRPSSTPRSRRCSPRTCGASLERARAAGLPEPAIMQSYGGLTDVARRPRTPR